MVTNHTPSTSDRHRQLSDSNLSSYSDSHDSFKVHMSEMTSTPSPRPPSHVYVVLWRDSGGNEFVALGAYAHLKDANREAHRLGREQLSDGLLESTMEADLKSRDSEPLRWDTADGISCWVERHDVK